MIPPEKLLAVARWVEPKRKFFEHKGMGLCFENPPYFPVPYDPLADTTEGKAQLMDVLFKLLHTRMDGWEPAQVQYEWILFVSIRPRIIPLGTDATPNKFFCFVPNRYETFASAVLEAASYAIGKGLVR